MTGVDASGKRPSTWVRLVMVHVLQLPAVALLLVAEGSAVPWIAGIWGSVVCCAGTDSGWRWCNRLLVLEAVVWLTLALVGGALGGR